jgi:hypothetical protein
MSAQPFAVPAEYRPLHKYLRDRYADTVRLTFTEIEDLIGVSLPEVARVDQAWWANPAEGSPASAQSHAWIQADRRATPNLRARSVAFERGQT